MIYEGSAFPIFHICQYAKDHVTVMLSGEGSDELFSGYEIYRAQRLAKHYRRLPHPVQRLTAYLAQRLPVSDNMVSLVIKLLRNELKHVRFVVSAWDPKRAREVLSEIADDDINIIGNEGLFFNPLKVLGADVVVICGDMAISESLLRFLPLYWLFRAVSAKLLGKVVVFLGIEAEKINLTINRIALKYVIDKATDYFILRNNISLNNLRELSVKGSSLLSGCEPSLCLVDSDIQGFEYHNPMISSSKLLVGFGIRDFFLTFITTVNKR